MLTEFILPLADIRAVLCWELRAQSRQRSLYVRCAVRGIHRFEHFRFRSRRHGLFQRTQSFGSRFSRRILNRSDYPLNF